MSLESKLWRTRSAQAARNKVHFSALPLTSHCSTCLYRLLQLDTIGWWCWCLTNLYKSNNNHSGFHPLRWTQPWAHQPRALLARIRWVGRRLLYNFLGKRAPIFGAGDRWGKEYMTAWKHLKGLERNLYRYFCTFLTHLEPFGVVATHKVLWSRPSHIFLLPWELQNLRNSPLNRQDGACFVARTLQGALDGLGSIGSLKDCPVGTLGVCWDAATVHFFGNSFQFIQCQVAVSYLWIPIFGSVG